ncbi:hypothetical protein BO224_12220 [Erysipelotrichaceae bacterium NYU-BL-E8]|uniref:Uncharacterized protein n=1 Tax=Ileibacterium valens TaxID=1862668 RepID=A0A1U7NEC8_9FIRM|nr:hypothetical protein BO224_12220 [Erysipelotrichaceae bacterium NYU-BL-E8]OLU37830.1 hypothetical protein BO222_09805 [Ileibacterium valens]OLU41877.1 hypothetical protein BM735_03545 [Erysipelotrichaceae bacterium NYU-BL-F16]
MVISFPLMDQPAAASLSSTNETGWIISTAFFTGSSPFFACSLNLQNQSVYVNRKYRFILLSGQKSIKKYFSSLLPVYFQIDRSKKSRFVKGSDDENFMKTLSSG